MKKTIIALLALSCVATAADVGLSSFTDISALKQETPDYVTWGNTGFTSSSASITVALTLNVDTLKEYMLAGKGKVKDVLVATWDSDVGSHGVGTNFSSGNTNFIQTSGIYAVLNGVPDKNVGMSTGVLGSESTDFWTDVTTASIVYTTNLTATDLDETKEGNETSAGTLAVLTLGKADGTSVTYGGDVWCTSINSNIVSYDKVLLGNSVIKAYAYDGVISASNAKALSMALAVPEPTTATLSLLALAGLAARRRRK